ncbi:MAG: type II toxin-antitoxin system PemK/MazF family toxin [Planctomycetota bacterium]
MSSVRHGEIRWYRFRQPDKERPVLLLSREAVVDLLNEIIVVPATRTVRGLASEVVLTQQDGMPTTCALNFDHITLVQRARLGAVITGLRVERWAEVRAAMPVACGFEPDGL